jgi:hypothetical protein
MTNLSYPIPSSPPASLFPNSSLTLRGPRSMAAMVPAALRGIATAAELAPLGRQSRIREALVPDVEAVTPTSVPKVRIRGIPTHRLNPDTVWGKVIRPSSPEKAKRFGGIVSQQAWRPCGSDTGRNHRVHTRASSCCKCKGPPWPCPSKHVRCITLSRAAGCRKYFHDIISAMKGD